MPGLQRAMTEAGHAPREQMAQWRREVLDLVEDLAVLEGALAGLDRELVDRTQSLRWLERARGRLTQLAERMAGQLEHTEGGPPRMKGGIKVAELWFLSDPRDAKPAVDLRVFMPDDVEPATVQFWVMDALRQLLEASDSGQLRTLDTRL